MAKITLDYWNDGKAKHEILRRLDAARIARAQLEDRWKQNEQAIYGSLNGAGRGRDSSYSIFEAVDSSDTDIEVSYLFKNFRYIHAQMSANPPSVVMRPATSDQEDHRRATAADKIFRHAMRKYALQERTDLVSLDTLLFGTGCLKIVWDTTQGDILSFDKATGEVVLEGDISFRVISPQNLYLDPDARTSAEIKWILEEIYMDFDEALVRWPGRKDVLEVSRVGKNEKENSFNVVKLLEYWETGLASNGKLGKYCVTTANGDVVHPCGPSPHSFRRAGTSYDLIRNQNIMEDVRQKRLDALPEEAGLPYILLTDVDVNKSVWGRSFLDYARNLQEYINQLDSAVMDNIKAHGNIKLVVPQDATVDDSLTNSPWDVVKISTTQPPHFMQMPQLMPEMSASRRNLIQGLNDVCGVNEFMFGQQSRETANAAMQYGVNQGNMIRRRLFNKYVLFVESMAKIILDLIRKHWSTERTIRATGKERALETLDFKGIDVDGGYDVVAEYGSSLPLDPITRRQEIIQLIPLYEKVGIPLRRLMKYLKLSEEESVHDEMELAECRQQEIFELMLRSGEYIPPEDLMDHDNMIAYALNYFMTSEFNLLPKNQQELLKQHIRDRGKLKAAEGLAPVPEEAPLEQV